MGVRSGIRRDHYHKGEEFGTEEHVNHRYGEVFPRAQPYIINGGLIESAMTRKASGYEGRRSMHTEHGQRRVDKQTGKKY